MTAKRGMQWKTAWRRQKQPIASDPVAMWFFHNAGAGSFSFVQALTTPSVGDAQPPFWCGFIAGLPTTTLTTPQNAGVYRAAGGVQAWQAGAQRALISGEEIYRAISSTFSLSTNIESLSPSISPITLRAVVVMLVVTLDVNNDVVAQLWVDGAVRTQIATGAAYVPGAGFLSFDPSTAHINSMAGGNVLPTTEEIQTWFSATRYASPFPSAQEIPGKTSDRYDAGITPGVVPSPIVNQSGGQNGVLTTSGGPTPENVLVAASFGY